VLWLCAVLACEAPDTPALALPPAAVADEAPTPADPITLVAAQPSPPPHPSRPPALQLTPPPPPQPPAVRVIFQGPSDANRIALTFDDGPSAELTPRVLDVLQHYDVHSTFFVLGRRAGQNPDVLRRIASEGHELGSHGWSHRSFRGLFHSQIREELADTAALIEEASGGRPRLLRPPFGTYADSATTIFEDMGLDVVLWTIDSRDWDDDPAKTVETIVRKARPGSIVLLHDSEVATLRALPQIIGSLQSRGFELVTVSELIGR
jgi:peptidoglycan/xylan/chitin deacetylase (PgdA/CDA1 family)